MIPDISDPKWRELVLGNKQYTFQSLGVKIMMSRILRSTANDPSQGNVVRCIAEVYEFFSKNHINNSRDLQQIFGAE